MDALLNNKVAVSSRERTSQVYLDKLRTAMKNASEGKKRCIRSVAGLAIIIEQVETVGGRRCGGLGI